MTPEEAKQGLDKAKNRLKELQEKGNAACSENDLRNGFDAKFNMNLVKNHVTYYQNKLDKFGKDLSNWM